jgi:molecular chaperone GrpE
MMEHRPEDRPVGEVDAAARIRAAAVAAAAADVTAAAAGRPTGTGPIDDGEEESPGPIVRDRRKVDSSTGVARPVTSVGSAPVTTPPADTTSPADPTESPGLGELAERTADLQRVQAEYANYRKRVARDREAMRELATASVLVEVLPILDDIGRARQHGELSGGFKSVAEALEATVVKLGLNPFGAVGDPFDPAHHEALVHSYADDVTEPTCVDVFSPGYRVGDRVVRPARVAVAEPSEDAAPID